MQHHLLESNDTPSQSSEFKPSSEMSFATVAQDCARLADYCQTLTSNDIQIDLRDVTHCDSAGLALLIEAKRFSNIYNKHCHIKCIPPAVQKLAEFCGIEAILQK